MLQAGDLTNVADLDLRLVRYFVAVADEGGFGRAAALLRVAQPSLSRQIGRLEARLSAQLLERAATGSTLTEAGAAFLPHARALLRLARDATAAIDAGAGRRTVVLGTVGELGAARVLGFARTRLAQVDVASRHLLPQEGASALASGTVDALLTRSPLVAGSELRATVLYDEPRVVLLPAGHRLARARSVAIEDIAEEPVVRSVGADAAWSAFWRLEPRADGLPAPQGPEVHGFEDKLDVVASGAALAVLPAGDRRCSLRDDVVTVPLDVPPCQVLIVTRAERDHVVGELAAIAQSVLTPDGGRCAGGAVAARGPVAAGSLARRRAAPSRVVA